MIKNRLVVYITILAILNATTFMGCLGRDPNPVDMHQTYDEKMGCRALVQEYQDNTQSIEVKKKKQSDTEAMNIVFFLAGFLTIVTFFLIDKTDAAKIEYEALESRNNHLKSLGRDKECDQFFMSQPQ